MKNLIDKVTNNINRYMNYKKMSELDKRIIEAEKDLIASCIRWESLLAVRDARHRTHTETVKMLRKTYRDYGFADLHLEGRDTEDNRAIRL